MGELSIGRAITLPGGAFGKCRVEKLPGFRVMTDLICETVPLPEPVSQSRLLVRLVEIGVYNRVFTVLGLSAPANLVRATGIDVRAGLIKPES